MATELSHFLQHLRPLKALAENWDIDLAHELSDYVDVVDRMTQQSMLHPNILSSKSEQSINFSQAALLIQNSAFIYAKKVQYLYNLTQEAHGSILGYKSKDAALNKHHSSEAAAAPFDVYESCFECLDEMIQLKQLTAAQETFKADPSLAAGFLPPAPQGYNQSLLPKEYELVSVQGDNIGAKCDFEINDSILDFNPTGMFYSNSFSGSMNSIRRTSAVSEGGGIEDGNNAPPAEQQVDIQSDQVLPDYDPMDFDGGNYSPGSPQMNDDQLVDRAGDLNDGPLLQQPPSPVPTAIDLENPPSVAADNQERQPEFPVVARCAPATSSATAGLIAAQQKSEEESTRERFEGFWAPLDPHESGRAQSRPFRKGQISRAFKLVEKTIRDRKSNLDPPLSIMDFLAGKKSDNSAAKYFQQSRGEITFDSLENSEFEYLLETTMTKNDRKKKHQKQKQLAAEQQQLLLGGGNGGEELLPIFEIPPEAALSAQNPQHLVDKQPDADFSGNNNDFDVGDGDDDFYDGGAADFDHENNLTAGGSEIIGSGVGDEIEDGENLFQSFEDLYQLRIQNYLKNAKEFEYQIESSLAKRVRGWENRLFPLMDEQNSRGTFDIHVYGEQLLEDLREISLSTDKRPDHRQIPLASVMAGKQPFEISRCFLASLHLANEGDVDLTADSDGQMLLQPI